MGQSHKMASAAVRRASLATNNEDEKKTDQLVKHGDRRNYTIENAREINPQRTKRLLPDINSYKNKQSFVRGEMFVEFNPLFDYFNNSITERLYEPKPRRKPTMEECKIIDEFCCRLSTSSQLFKVIRDLPEFGVKDWFVRVRRVLESYKQLWKYQIQYRDVLEEKYGLRRWQIGEIASKIGQLYYLYYQRTSNPAILNITFSFYYVIRVRSYYTGSNKEEKCELMVKTMRYYSRFIVVCLLQRKMKVVKDLVKELDRLIDVYGKAYNPDDQIEWANSSDEIKAFVVADPVVHVIHPDNYAVTLTHRMNSAIIPPIERSRRMNLELQEIVIVGNCPDQLKISDLSMDMYKMIQTFERQPFGNFKHTPISEDLSPMTCYDSTIGSHGQDYTERDFERNNPHKLILFLPTLGQVLASIASLFSNVTANGVLLLYMSADGSMPLSSKQPELDEGVSYEEGGLMMAHSDTSFRGKRSASSSAESSMDKKNIMGAIDLVSFTRKPMFVIVESDNSYSFKNVSRLYEQPLVVLMSPIESAQIFYERKRKGNLFTLFLHSPLTAFCYICRLIEVPLHIWERAQSYMEHFMAEASSIFVRSGVDKAYIAFMGDDFLRLLILRFVFCESVLRLHCYFHPRSYRTMCSPPLPEELYEHPKLRRIIMDLADLLQVRNYVNGTKNTSGPSTSHKK